MTTLVLSVKAALRSKSSSVPVRTGSYRVQPIDDHSLKLLQIQLPVRPSPLDKASVLRSLGRMQWHVNGLPTVEDDGGEVLVEEGLDTDDFVALVEEGKESGVHSCSCQRSRNHILASKLVNA